MLKLISPFILGERDWLYVDVEACQKTVCQIITEFSTRRGNKHFANACLCSSMFLKQSSKRYKKTFHLSFLSDRHFDKQKPLQRNKEFEVFKFSR